MYLLIIFLSITVVIILSYHLYLKTPQFGKMPEGALLERIQQSPNFRHGRFRNRERINEHMSLSKVPVLIRQNRDKKISKRPTQQLSFNFEQPEEAKEGQLSFTWFGHSALLIQLDGKKILIDPMLGPYASPVPGTVRRFSEAPVDQWNEMPEIDIVIYSHDHYDHLDYYTFKRIKDKVRHFVMPLGVSAHLMHWGLPAEKITECDWGDELDLGAIKLVCCPTKHFSGRSPKGRNTTLWSAWVIRGISHKLYFSSDSGYFSGFHEIGRQYGPFDICFVECGQYNILWKENHMMPEESFQAFMDLDGRYMVPIHWGAFSLAPHDWREPVERVLAEAKRRGEDNRIIISQPGRTVQFENNMPQERWWLEEEVGQY